MFWHRSVSARPVPEHIWPRRFLQRLWQRREYPDKRHFERSRLCMRARQWLGWQSLLTMLRRNLETNLLERCLHAVRQRPDDAVCWSQRIVSLPMCSWQCMGQRCLFRVRDWPLQIRLELAVYLHLLREWQHDNCAG
mgnify:CR=1 FL=1